MRRVLSPVPIAVLCTVAALVALLAYGLSQNKADRQIDEALAAGEPEPAPALELPMLDATRAGSLTDYRGRLVVLNFWASWCEPCREESPLLQNWHRRMASRGGTVLGVDTLDVTGDAQDFIREYGLTYPMLKDRGGDAAQDYGVAIYPETFVIDPRGRIVAVRRGPVDEEFLRTEVEPRLNGS